MKKDAKSNRCMVVVGDDAEKYDCKDNRAMKPILIKCLDHPKYPLNHAFQHADSVKITKKKKLEYFVPNNISLLLSNSSSALEDAEKMYHEVLLKRAGQEFTNKTNELWNNCFYVSNYIEKIQTAIVFSYTALEAFANISIPDDHIYTSSKNSKGVKEEFDKKAIERWLSLKDKLDIVLPKVYSCEKISKQDFWSHFILLETFRNQIIHQKAIESTNFYHEYFKLNIFKILRVAEKVVCYYHDVTTVDTNERAQANLMWPWLPGAMTAPVLRNPEPILGWTIDHTQPSVQERLTDKQRQEIETFMNKDSHNK